MNNTHGNTTIDVLSLRPLAPALMLWKQLVTCALVSFTFLKPHTFTSFFPIDPAPLHSIQRSGGAPGSSGEPLGFGVKKWYFFKRSGQGSNPGPRASEEDALTTPLRPTWQVLLHIGCFSIYMGNSV